MSNFPRSDRSCMTRTAAGAASGHFCFCVGIVVAVLCAAGAMSLPCANPGACAQPGALAVNPITNKIYVTNELNNQVTVIDGATNAVSTVSTGMFPLAVAVNSSPIRYTCSTRGNPRFRAQ
jgi:YVTN family beta-propeller protein